MMTWEGQSYEKKNLLLTFPERGGHIMPYSHRRSIRMVRRKKTGTRGKSKPQLLLGFL